MTENDAKQIIETALKEIEEGGFQLYVDVKTGCDDSETIGPYTDMRWLRIRQITPPKGLKDPRGLSNVPHD